MNKIIVTKDPEGNTTEHPGKSLKEIVKEYGGKNLEVFLDRYLPGTNNCGWIFYKSARIGNLRQPLDYTDYYAAYDQIF